MLEPLTLRLFGPFVACIHGAPLPRLLSRKGQQLLALLTLLAGRGVERAWLAGTLWSDSSAEDALRSLRTSLWDLRRALGPEADRLHSPTRHTLALDLSGADADVVAFDAAITRGDCASLEEAVARYRGALLEGWAEEWVFPERQAREQAYVAARERLAAQAVEGDDVASAEQHLRQAVAADPLRESAQRALMQVLAKGGNYAAALHVYRELRLLLHRELNASPDPETGTLFQALREAGQKAKPLSRRRETSESTRVGAPDLTRETQEPRHNLPPQPTPLLGREHELAAAGELLLRDDVRLLTLAGPPGTGKTRLGVQLAAVLLPSFADGVCFVSLAPISDPGLVVSTIAHTLGMREGGDRPLLESLKEVLCEKQLLLLLDNFEQVLEAAPVIGELAAAGRRLKVLVTSRAVLRVRGEQEFPVPPLPVPPVGAPLVGARVGAEGHPQGVPLQQYAAVELFIQRAAGVKPDFLLAEENAQAVAAICRRLDGLPLAIELAAARIKLFSPEALLGRLEHRLKLLTGGPRDLPARQQTLRSAIDWSYHLLDEREKQLFRRLSVFVGGCTLEAAEAVCRRAGARPAGSNREIDVLEAVASLVDKHLLQREEQTGDQPRFGMLETIREYAREQLVESGEAEDIRRQHAVYFLELAQARSDRPTFESHAAWMDRLEREHDNLRAAVGWTVECGEGELGLQLGAALGEFWIRRGYLNEARDCLGVLLELPGASARTAVRAQVLNDAGGVVTYQTNWRGDGGVFWEEALSIWRELGEEGRVAGMLLNLGNLRAGQGDRPAALALHEEALGIFRRIGDQKGELASLNLLAFDIEAQGDTERAQELWEQALSMRAAVDDVGIDIVLRRLGRLARQRGDYATARARYAESLENCRKLGNKLGMPDSLEHFGSLAVDQGQAVRAARLFGAGAALRDAIGLPRARVAEAEIAAAREALGEEAFAAAWAECRAMSLEEITEFALKDTGAGLSGP